MKHNYSLQIIARVLLLCLFLQSCSSFANAPLESVKEKNKVLDLQAVLDREFIAEGSHLVSFYQHNEDIKASVQVNPLDEKDKIYDDVDIVIEKGVELSDLANLDRKTQQKRIQIRFSEEQKGKPKSVVIHKPWIMGGNGEAIMFCGNPGVGKSALCNSIFQQAIFRSGVSIRTGMTTGKQEYQHQGKIYIDTPGLADVDTRKQAAKEIEEALKKNGNYKIVFVITLESGRLKPEDMATVETVCEAIRVPFEYGLIINKVTRGIRQEIIDTGIESCIKKYGSGLDTNNPEVMAHVIQTGLSDFFFKGLNKKPYATIMLMKDGDMEDEPGKYFVSGSANMIKLLNFLGDLKANGIKESDVSPLDVTNYKEKAQAQEKINDQLREDLREMQRENRRQISNLDKKIDELNEEIKKKDDGFWVKVGKFGLDLGGVILKGILKQPHRPYPEGPGSPGCF